MTKAKNPVVDADPKAVESWDNEGGAPASGDQSSAKHPKRPRDTNQLAKFIVDVATGEAASTPDAPKVARAKKGGAAGGPARARALTPEQRAEIAHIAAQARWKKSN